MAFGDMSGINANFVCGWATEQFIRALTLAYINEKSYFT